MPEFSVIVPVDRTGEDFRRAIASLLEQQSAVPFEIILVGPEGLDVPPDERIRHIECADRNPARRRNLAAAAATGTILAFMDDDAIARGDWLQNAFGFFEKHPETLAVGGPDPAPDDSSIAQLISDTLLAAPLIGSGVAAHENRQGSFSVVAPHDLALVNLFVKKEAFVNACGFDESIGYIGEDTALLENLIAAGPVFYDSSIVVFHRRRDFPGEYLRQRWRYRLKTGELLLRAGSRYRTSKVLAFLAAGLIFLGVAIVSVRSAAVLLIAYLFLTLSIGSQHTRLPKRWWPVIPFAFALHHATYFCGIIAGFLRAALLPKRRLPLQS